MGFIQRAFAERPGIEPGAADIEIHVESAIRNDRNHEVKGGKTVKNDKQVAALQAENTELKERLALFEDRVIVLERIATDKSVGLAAQIENLRTGEKVQ